MHRSSYSPAGKATVTLRRDGKDVSSQSVQLQAGDNVVSFTDNAGSTPAAVLGFDQALLWVVLALLAWGLVLLAWIKTVLSSIVTIKNLLDSKRTIMAKFQR